MNNYEMVFIVESNLDEEKYATVQERIKKQIETADGAIDSIDDWGNRRLAYPIGKRDEGHYLLYNFKMKPDHVIKLHTQMKITPGIVRFVIVRKGDDKDA